MPVLRPVGKQSAHSRTQRRLQIAYQGEYRTIRGYAPRIAETFQPVEKVGAVVCPDARRGSAAPICPATDPRRVRNDRAIPAQGGLQQAAKPRSRLVPSLWVMSAFQRRRSIEPQSHMR